MKGGGRGLSRGGGANYDNRIKRYFLQEEVEGVTRGGGGGGGSFERKRRRREF